MLRSRPTGLSGIALIDTKATADHPEAQIQRRAVAHHMRTEADVHAFADAMVPRLISETTVRDHPEVATVIHEWIRQAEPLTIAWLQEAMADRPDSVHDLGGFAGPALLLRGRDDLVCSAQDYEVMQSALPHATYVEIAGCGHLPPIENAQATSAALVDWLEVL
jgi:pimeloyl-ACP methyl ester carboxylesterase